MRIAFLHLPKTAGQAVDGAIREKLPSDRICPARVNQKLYTYSVKELRRFDFFSGHIDWSLVRLSGKFDFTFTVLREPMDRILSLYFFMKEVASNKVARHGRHGMSNNDLALADGSPRDYFADQDINSLAHINNHYNNLYSYYFSTGSFSGYTHLSGNHENTMVPIHELAFYNLSTISRVYTFNTLSQIADDLKSQCGLEIRDLRKANVNQAAPGGSAARMEKMESLSKGWDWLTLFNEFTAHDNQLITLLQKANRI
jgi:hypothetical protein